MAEIFEKDENISLENVCLMLANDLILRFDLPLIRIVHLKQIRSPFVICLYDSVVGSVPPEVFLHPKSDEEEVFNIKTITERLKSDLKRSLDPLKVLQGDPDSIYELFCLFLSKAENRIQNQSPIQEIDERISNCTSEEKKNDDEHKKENDDVDGNCVELDSNDNDRRPSFIEFVCKELSDMDVSIATKRQLIKKYKQYILFEVKTVSDAQKCKSKSLILLEDARTRQASLVKLLSKEIELGKRLETIEARRREQLAEKGRVRDGRIQSARLRRIRNDVEASRCAKQKPLRKNRKELILKEICEENLAMRKTRLLTRLKDEKEQRLVESAKAELRCKSATKFYEDQVVMMADKLKTEKASIFLQERANSKLVDRLKREERKERIRKVRKLEDQAKHKWEHEAQIEEEEAQRMKRDLWKNF